MSLIRVTQNTQRINKEGNAPLYISFYLGKEKVEIREIPLPEVGDNDVLVRNIYSSVCGTDVAVFMHGPNTGHKVTVGGKFD